MCLAVSGTSLPASEHEQESMVKVKLDRLDLKEPMNGRNEQMSKGRDNRRPRGVRLSKRGVRISKENGKGSTVYLLNETCSIVAIGNMHIVF